MDELPQEVYEQVKAILKMRLVDVLDGMPHHQQLADQRQRLEERLRQMIQTSQHELRVAQISADEEERLLQDIVEEVVGLGPLERLLIDPTVTEIMVNGPSDLFVERSGKVERAPAEFRFKDTAHLYAVIERLLSPVGVSVNEAEPCVDAHLSDGSRINVIIPPLALNGPTLTIRKKGQEFTVDEWVHLGALSRQAAEFLEACVKSRVNMIVSGGTSTGKTTLVSILSAFMPADERIITIENVAELELLGRKHWVRLVARPPNPDGRGEVTLRTLVKNALRMRPDRIVLGEARGGEALDVIQAMHTGHEGVITILHANSPQAALERLQTLMLMSGLDLPHQICQTQIASVVDVVIHLARFPDGTRQIASIAQILEGVGGSGFNMEELFTFDVHYVTDGRLDGTLRYTGVRPKFLQKLQLGNPSLPLWMTT